MASRIFGRHRRAHSESGLAGAARIVEFALWLAWSTLILRSVGADHQFIRSPARLASEVGAVILIITSLHWMVKLRPRDGRARARRWALLMLWVCVPPALYGLARGNSIIGWALMGVFPFMSAACIVLGAQKAIMDKVERALFWQVAFGVVFALYVLAFHPPQSRLDWNGVTGMGLGKHANRVLAGTSFLLPLIHRMPLWRATTVLIGMALYVVLAISGSSRGMLLIGAVLLPIGLLFANANTKRPWFKPLLRATIGAGLLVGIGLWSTNRLTSFSQYFSNQWESTASRMTGGEAHGTFGEIGTAAFETSATEFSAGYSRGAELKSFFEQFEFFDFISGRGFGGTWYSSFWRTEWGMVHIGPGHLLLQGGVPLLLAFTAVFTLAIFSAWKGRTSDHAAGALLYLLAFVQHFMQHGAIQDDYEVYLAWICVGVALTASARLTRPLTAPNPASHLPRLSPELLHGGHR